MLLESHLACILTIPSKRHALQYVCSFFVLCNKMVREIASSYGMGTLAVQRLSLSLLNLSEQQIGLERFQSHSGKCFSTNVWRESNEVKYRNDRQKYVTYPLNVSLMHRILAWITSNQVMQGRRQFFGNSLFYKCHLHMQKLQINDFNRVLSNIYFHNSGECHFSLRLFVCVLMCFSRVKPCKMVTVLQILSYCYKLYIFISRICWSINNIVELKTMS